MLDFIPFVVREVIITKREFWRRNLVFKVALVITGAALSYFLFKVEKAHQNDRLRSRQHPPEWTAAQMEIALKRFDKVNAQEGGIFDRDAFILTHKVVLKDAPQTSGTNPK